MILRVFDKRRQAYVGRPRTDGRQRFVLDPDMARIYSSLSGVKNSMTNGLPQYNPFDWDWFRVEQLRQGLWQDVPTKVSSPV